MSSYWSNAIHLTVCPFFIRESIYAIKCEGLIDGSDTISKFDSEDSKAKYQKSHCYLFDENCCILRRCLNEKYK